MSLYKDTYETIVTNIANSIYERTKNIIEQIKDNGTKVGISISPDTSLEDIKPYLSQIHMVLVMTVVPGKGGQSFMDVSLDKISYLNQFRKDNKLSYVIEVDGGINSETGLFCKEKGVDIRFYNIIYKVVEEMEAALKGKLEPTYEEQILGQAEVRKLFKF